MRKMEMSILFQIHDLKQMGIVLKQTLFMNFMEIIGMAIPIFMIIINLIIQQNALMVNYIKIH